MAEVEDKLCKLTIDSKEMPSTDSIVSVELAPSSFVLHSFSTNLNDSPYNFHTILMDKSIFIWIGNSLVLNNMAMAMMLMSSVSTGTVLLGNPTDNVSDGIAKRLSKRLEKQVFVSYNAEADKMLVSGLEKRLLEEIAEHPEKF